MVLTSRELRLWILARFRWWALVAGGVGVGGVGRRMLGPPGGSLGFAGVGVGGGGRRMLGPPGGSLGFAGVMEVGGCRVPR